MYKVRSAPQIDLQNILLQTHNTSCPMLKVATHRANWRGTLAAATRAS